MSDPVRPLKRTRAKDVGVQVGSARFMPTDDTEKHVKFAGLNTEARHATANEFLGNRLSERLGVERPQSWAVELPPELKAGEAALTPVADLMGFGMDRMPWPDLNGALIAQAAQQAADLEVLAQIVVLTWLQVRDHEDHNFMQDGDRVLAVDFASGPGDDVWGGGTLGEERVDHGGLRDRATRISRETKSVMRKRLEAIDAATLDADLTEMPGSWATPDERAHVRDELLRVKGGIISDLL